MPLDGIDIGNREGMGGSGLSLCNHVDSAAIFREGGREPGAEVVGAVERPQSHWSGR